MHLAGRVQGVLQGEDCLHCQGVRAIKHSQCRKNMVIGEVVALRSSVNMKGNWVGIACQYLSLIVDKRQLPAKHASQFCPRNKYDQALA